MILGLKKKNPSSLSYRPCLSSLPPATPPAFLISHSDSGWWGVYLPSPLEVHIEKVLRIGGYPGDPQSFAAKPRLLAHLGMPSAALRRGQDHSGSLTACLAGRWPALCSGGGGTLGIVSKALWERVGRGSMGP